MAEVPYAGHHHRDARGVGGARAIDIDITATELEDAVAIANVAPADVDVYDPKRFRGKTHTSAPERAAIAALLDAGLVDVTRAHLPGPDIYTWWGYRPGQFEKNRGLRIDLALCTQRLADRVADVWIDRTERADTQPQKPSDHAPLVLTIA